MNLEIMTPKENTTDTTKIIDESENIILEKKLEENPPKQYQSVFELYNNLMLFEKSQKNDSKQKTIYLYLLDNHQGKLYNIENVKISNKYEINLSSGIQNKHAFILDDTNINKFQISIIN